MVKEIKSWVITMCLPSQNIHIPSLLRICRMLTVYFLVSCVLSATYAVAVEHPIRRYSRSHDAERSPKLMVKPEFIEMRRGETVKVRCRARGGRNIDDLPFITFYVSIYPFEIEIWIWMSIHSSYRFWRSQCKEKLDLKVVTKIKRPMCHRLALNHS